MDAEPLTTARIGLDWNRCIGAGMCEDIAPSAFRVDDDGLVELGPDLVASDAGPLGPDLSAEVTRAAEACPARAIILGPAHPSS